MINLLIYFQPKVEKIVILAKTQLKLSAKCYKIHKIWLKIFAYSVCKTYFCQH